MAEYIEREKVKTLIKNYGIGAIEDGRETLDPVDDIVLLARGVDLIPTADVEEVVHGEWKQNQHYPSHYYCTKCGRHVEDGTNKPSVHYPYCHCGAKMDGKDNE